MIINQKRLGGNSRSTVGTISDIYASVRLLWSRIGEPFVGYSDIFSFNNPKGMCQTCSGLGYVEDIDLNELLDYDKSLNEDAIKFLHLDLIVGEVNVIYIQVYLIMIRN